MGKGWANQHGHSHGRLTPLLRQFDVGVEVWNFRPVQLAEVIRGLKDGVARRSVTRSITSSGNSKSAENPGQLGDIAKPGKAPTT